MDTPNYNETTVTGTAYNRCYSVRVQNPKDGVPMLTLYEEKVTILADETIHKAVGEFNIQFDPANEDHLALYNLLNGFYIAEREKRDNPPAADPEPAAEPQ